MYSARPYEKKRKPQPKRRERKPFAPAVRCAIQSVASGYRVAVDRDFGVIPGAPTIFPSHNKAKKALWHICQQLPPKFMENEPDRYIIVKGV